MRVRILAFAMLVLIAPLSSSLAQQASDSNYDASSGSLPNQVCPPWNLHDTASPEDPTLAGSALVISTSLPTENMVYRQQSPQTAIPDPLVIEFQARFVSGTSNSAARTPMMVALATAPETGSLFGIKNGEIFLTGGVNAKGPSASVATSGDFHTYRIEAFGSGHIDVYYDNVLTLTGSTYVASSEFGSVTFVAFGELSSLTYGVSEWRSFSHNASAVSCEPADPIAFNALYDASFGWLPDQTCPPWSLLDTASPEDPTVSDSALILSTSSNEANVRYEQQAPEIEVPDPLVIEFRAKYVSGSSSSAARTPMMVAVTTVPEVGVLLGIGSGEIFLTTAGVLTKVASAFVATSDSIHAYRVEVRTSGLVTVFYDGKFALTGSTYLNAAEHGATPRVAFGELSLLSFGTSEWASVQHNASTAFCRGTVSGRVFADCPGPNTGLLGVTVDAFEVGTGDLVGTDTTDVDGAYAITDLQAGEYTISIVTPLGYSIPSNDLPVSVLGGATATIDFSLSCLDIDANARGGGFWKHQVAVATGGKGKAQVDGPTLCGYLDVIEAHFNSNAINQVVVYAPPESGACSDKLEVAKDLLNLKGNVGMTARAKQHLMSLLLNVSAGFVSLAAEASEDGATVSQAITYCDNLIDDPAGDDEAAKDVAETINSGDLVPAGVIPLTTANIAYRRPPVLLAQNHPNPFAAHTAIRFRLDSMSEYNLSIYNMAGQLVRKFSGAGEGEIVVSWDGRDNARSRVAPGIYFYQLRAGDQVQTKRMVLMD